jgi:putative flippase GtrA
MGKLLGEAAKYAAASAVALLVDTGLLLGLSRYAGWDYRAASVVSFMAGASVAYVLSVKFVFHAHRLRSRRLEFSWFVALGLVGVAVNMLVLFIVHGELGFDLILAKGMSAGCTFLTNFALRRQLLFRVGAFSA